MKEKAIINGIRFNTENAVLIGSAEAAEYQSDFRWWYEELYKTPRSGRYFIAGKGNGMSQWAEPVPGGGRGSGRGIRPLTREDALAWAERYLDPATVEEHFADLIEDA